LFSKIYPSPEKLIIKNNEQKGCRTAPEVMLTDNSRRGNDNSQPKGY
jgi:hypothetical protein